MGGIFLNPEGNNAFTEIVNNRISKVFVDKTGFIGETIDRLDSDLKLIAFTRPRRFGKTIMARMLASYYSKSVRTTRPFSSSVPAAIILRPPEKFLPKYCPAAFAITAVFRENSNRDAKRFQGPVRPVPEPAP